MRRFMPIVPFVLAIAGAAACGSSTQSVTAPSTSKCPLSAAAQPSAFGSGGGNGIVAVTTNRECAWSASASGNWIQLAAQAAGQGEGQVGFSVSANRDPSERRGAITVGEQQLAISQEASPCVFGVAPTSQSVSPAGERRTIIVTASSTRCSWAARSDVGWIAIVEGAQGTGNGAVAYEVHGTTGPARTGTLVVAGQTVTVTQGVGCSTSISPTSQTVGAGGGSGSISVSTAEGCPWASQSDAPWIALTSGQSGSGPGTVGFSVAAWNGSTRAGTLRVDGHVFTVTQASGCTYSIDPSSQNFASGGGAGSIAVTAGAGCAWTASASQPWVRITSGAAGSGSGTIQFSVDASSGPARAAAITAGGQTFAIQQSTGCAYSLSAMSAHIAAGGGTGSVSVTTGTGCAWVAVSNPADAWARITSGATGSGSGTVSFTVDPNAATTARTTTLTIAGQAVSISQDGAPPPCTYTIAPTSQMLGAAETTGSFNVDTAANCAWTATSTVAWLAVTAGASGTGSGAVSYRAAANTGPERSGTIVAGGQTFTAIQASGCTVTIAPAGQAFTAAAGTGTISVSTEAGCPWTASVTSGADWITITAGSSGGGAGTVEFSVSANTGAARSGAIRVGGVDFTVTQGGG